MAATDQILDAALGVVQTDGLSALTIDAVAQKAAFSKGGVLYHFPSKERLIAGLVARFVRSFEADLEGHLERDSGASGAWTRAYIETALSSRVRGAQLFATLGSALAVDPGLLAPLRERYRYWQQRLENDGLPPALATMVRMACEGLWLCEVLDLGAPEGALRQQTIDLLLHISQTNQSQTQQERTAMAGMEWFLPVEGDSRHFRDAAVERSAERIDGAVTKAASALGAMQTAEGYWCGALTADSTLQSDYVLLQLWLHAPQNGGWNPPTRARIAKAARSILREQLRDGGWPIYPDGPSEVNASVKAYVALKLAGHRADAAEMAKARERILALGGVQECNSYVKINLSLFGLYPRNHVPSVPPEIMLVPGGVLYEMSSWTRTIVVPLSIVQASGDERPVPEGFDVEEIFHPDGRLMRPRREGLAILFHHLDKLVKLWGRRGPKNLRQSALREAERWILERTRHSEGLGAIYPAMMYHIMALHCLGYAEDHPDLVEAMRHFDNLLLETEDALVFQPAVSPVWDTAYGAFALAESGTGDEAALTRAADWLISKEIRRKGDWAIKRPNLEPSGWAFEFANEYYPDIDDTAAVLLALVHAKGSDAEKQQRCVRRAVQWLIGMQSEDGGWAAFDADNNWQILNKVPFADHNAMLDPTCPDITGRVLDALSRYGYSLRDEPVRRGVDFLLRTQEKNGSWYGRWGVNYLYGTFLALRGLAAVRADQARAQMERAARWIRSIQNKDGGWGESCASYVKEQFVPGASTASQTAWALLALYASGDADSSAVERGVEYLLSTQRGDGTWEEHLATGTGFPNVFFLTYHLYRQYFPLLALGTLAKAGSAQGDLTAVVTM
jgi:squalene-hopene/tetraprenyl-beta-curcumene cyclase